ncbi:MAG: hypothetical protein RLZZ416_273 [Candidatus Parcubacteria bacterium]|jgi:hypothetical protein
MADKVVPGSFIPHDTAVTTAVAKPKHKGGLNDLLLLSAIVLLVASVALAIGVFLYAQFLTTEKKSKVDQLQRAKAAFEPSLIQQLTRLDDRMHAGDLILGAHVAPTAFFRALEQATLQTVAFQTLDFEAPDVQHMAVKMAGVAESVNAIALQADIFSKNGVITGPIFSNIARQEDGVHFDLTAVVNPGTVNYASVLTGAMNSNPQGQQPQQSPAPAAPSPFENPESNQSPAAPSQGQGNSLPRVPTYSN